MSTASHCTWGDNRTHGHTSRHQHSSSASHSISFDRSFSVALRIPTSQAVPSAVSQATSAQPASLEDLLSYIRGEIQHDVSQATATHDASPPASSQHSSLPQLQLASAAGGEFFCVIMYIYHVHGNLQGSIFLLQAFLYPMHVCYAVWLLASHMYWYM